MTTQPRTEQRVAIVTGGSRGIGRQIAQQLAADGFAVVVGYAGNKDAADEAVRAIEAAGGTAYAARADVADETEIAALFDQAEATYGGVDAVVHAAGRMPSPRSRSSTSPSSTPCTAPTSAAPSSSTSRPRAGCALAARS